MSNGNRKAGRAGSGFQGRGGAMMQAQAGGHEPAGVTLGKSLDLSFLNSKMNIDSPVSTTGP